MCFIGGGAVGFAASASMFALQGGLGLLGGNKSESKEHSAEIDIKKMLGDAVKKEIAKELELKGKVENKSEGECEKPSDDDSKSLIESLSSSGSAEFYMRISYKEAIES